MKVSQSHFGAIYTGFPQDAQFLAVLNEIGAHVSRWPGGTLSELRTDVYDISQQRVFDPTFLYTENPERKRMSYEDVLQLPDGIGHLNIIVPTFRYIDDISSGLADIEFFLVALAANDSLDGTKIRLEIGNEYYALEGFSASEYGEIANAFVSHIADYDTSSFQFELEVSVQAGKTVPDSNVILASFDDTSLARIDAVNIHSLPINHTNLYLGNPSLSFDGRFSELESIYSLWNAEYSTLGLAEPELHLTAWGVGAAASSPSEVDLAYQDYGARGAGTALALFSEMLELNVTEASVWGVGVGNLNTLGEVIEGSVVLSHFGLAFKELGDSVVELEYLGGFGSLEWTDNLLEFGHQAYAAPGRAVVYAVSGDSEVSSTANLSSNLPGFDAQSARVVEAKTVTTGYSNGYVPNGSSEDRLYEVPVVLDVSSEPGVSDLSDGWIQFNHQEEFQFTEVTISWRHTGSNDDDLIEGILHADEFAGASGNDTIMGFGGNDSIIGGLGRDQIDGGDGDDILIGDGYSAAEMLEYWEVLV